MSKPFQCIAGAEDFLVQRRGKEIWEDWSRGVEDEFGKEIVDGAVLKVEEVGEAVTRFQQAVETLPMFGGGKVVWFRGLSFLADNPLGRSESTLKELERVQFILEKVNPAEVRVLLTASPVDRRRAFYKYLQKTGETEWMADPAGKGGMATLTALVEECCTREGVRIEPMAVEVLIGRLSGSTRLIEEEVRKLATYLGSGGEAVITPSLVMELVPVFGEGDFFEATEALYSGKVEWALDAVRKHFFGGQGIRPLLSSWQGRNRLLIQLRVLSDSGDLAMSRGRLDGRSLERAQAQFAEYFGGKTEKNSFQIFGQHPFYLGKLAELARKRSLRQWMDWQEIFARAFAETLRQYGSEEQIARQVVLQCLGDGP